MQATICPTVTAADADTYQRQVQAVAGFATRLHIDVSDGTLAPTRLMPVDGIWWPGGVRADIHVMSKRPLDHLAALIALQPQLIIVHAESSGSFADFAAACHHHGIETGVALLQPTPVDVIQPGLDIIDHVLIFSGDLGKFGGKADPGLLPKIKALKQLKPQLEIGWDGGINERNIGALVKSGVEVLNIGGGIHGAEKPEYAFHNLKRLAGQS